MSSIATATLFFTLLLFPLFHVCLAARDLVASPRLSSLVRIEMRTLTLGPKRSPGRFFHDKEVRGCLPKGFRHASAPSRFANYHTFGWTGCRATNRSPKKP
uniref:Secreted protein n=1 Tax=Kalanchoe fedtschenkoi TaxID=63787 RepID=A0A7N0RCV1_KALFE